MIIPCAGGNLLRNPSKVIVSILGWEEQNGNVLLVNFQKVLRIPMVQ